MTSIRIWKSVVPARAALDAAVSCGDSLLLTIQQHCNRQNNYRGNCSTTRRETELALKRRQKKIVLVSFDINYDWSWPITIPNITNSNSMNKAKHVFLAADLDGSLTDKASVAWHVTVRLRHRPKCCHLHSFKLSHRSYYQCFPWSDGMLRGCSGNDGR